MRDGLQLEETAGSSEGDDVGLGIEEEEVVAGTAYLSTISILLASTW